MKAVGIAAARRPLKSRRTAGKPVTVSFSGLDGAGKTRAIEALVEVTGRRRSVDVLWLPTEVWPASLLNQIPARFRSRLGPERPSATASHASGSDGQDGDPREHPSAPKGRRGLRGGARSATWAVIGTVAAVSVGLSLRRRASGSEADVLVLDRYRLDSIVKLQCWYSEVSGSWLARVVAALAPAPDIEFLLRVDPAVAYARKAEQWSPAQLSRQARLYDELAVRPLGVVTVNANEAADELAREVGSHVRAFLDGC